MAIPNLFFYEQNQLVLMFVSAFLSSTVLPGNSEIVFSTLLMQQQLEPQTNLAFALFLCATLGNSLGSFTTYAIARFVPEPRLKSDNKMGQWALQCSKKYGGWILLLSWLPVVGDLLCGIAGWLRLNYWQSFVFICLGKALRYAILWWGVTAFI